MLWCRTRRSTSPRETSRSINRRRNSPEATSRRRSPMPSDGSSTSRRLDARASTRSWSASGPVPAEGPVHRRPSRDLGELLVEPLRALPRLSQPERQVRRPHRAHPRVEDARRGGQACRLAWPPRARQRQLRQQAGRGDPRRRRDARGAPRQGPARALRDGRPVRPAAGRRGSRHLTRRRSSRVRRSAVRRDAGEPAPAISVRGLRKSFGEQLVLDGIDLEVAEGTVFALLGPNGAGKTTDGPHPVDA